ncbi:MAG: hypothetical protein DME26_07415 [Verrucomicrobia bacterium]|nr:MAG: hypothetical protein DME26_07415 [Verrucomicrobiota bacterium]
MFLGICASPVQAGTMQLKMGSATVPVAAIGVPPMAPAAHPLNQRVIIPPRSAGRRDADQSVRDARAPRF